MSRWAGERAIHLRRPIEFGDSYVDVAYRGEEVAGYRFTVYFQMDKESRRLKRILLERQSHGANPRVFGALTDLLTRDYGPPAETCDLLPSARTGYQGTVERLWRTGGTTVRAVFRDTTLEAAEGCVHANTGACGLAARLQVQIVPGSESCA